MKIGKLPIKLFILVIANDLIDTFAQLMIKKGLGQINDLTINSFFLKIFNPNNPDIIFIYFGIAIFIFNFILWMNILSKLDLSIAIPLGSASYILLPLLTMIFLHEKINPLRWIALVFIVLGIYFISRAPSTTGHEKKNA